MRLLASLAALVLLTACSSAGAAGSAPGDAAPRYRVVANAAYASATGTNAIVAADETAYRNTWSSMIGAGEAPAVDFATETAVFLFGGERPTGGYSVAVRGVRVEGDTLVVDGSVNAPPPDAMSTQAITSPYAVIAVKTRGVRNVRWNP
ncbi:MAG TPA: protease complex subunit PrcB family protein [Thermoanaerobaculia bacterium]|jgi:hypothetical protein